MVFAQAALAIVLLIINSLGPGLLLVRYLRWRPLESLCASVALSLFWLYLVTFGIYILNLPSSWAYATTGIAVVATILCARDLRRLWRNSPTRATMLAFLSLVVWLFLLLMLVRGYSGANWYGDWFEHYERALFFTEHKPLDTSFLNGLYILPARPPMMNILATAVFWQVAPTFEVFQVVFAFLNALVIIPCVLVSPSLVARTSNRAWLIAGFLALSPMFTQNAVFTWTKELSAFYALSALGLYLSAWRRNEPWLMVAAVACCAAGMLVHYSVAPIAVFLAGHYLFVLCRRRSHRWLEIAASAAVGGAILATWLGWSAYAYGWKDTFMSNTAVTSSQQFSGTGNVSKVAQNTYYSLVPFFMRGIYDIDLHPQFPPKGVAHFRDWCFYAYQNTLPTMLGIGGLILVIWLLARYFLRPTNDPWQHWLGFWFSFMVVVTLVGIAVNGELNYFGVTHICLQSLLLLGVTLAAVGLPQVPRSLRTVAVVGLLFDAIVGILIHFHLLQCVYDLRIDGDQLKVDSHAEMGISAISNALLKLRNDVAFLGDHAVSFATFVEATLNFGVLGICAGLWFLAEYSGTKGVRSVSLSEVSSASFKRRK